MFKIMKTDDLNKTLKLLIEKDPARMIAAEFVFDATSPLLENNLNITYNHFTKWNVTVDSTIRGSNEYRIVCGSIQVKICSNIIEDCLSLKTILMR